MHRLISTILLLLLSACAGPVPGPQPVPVRHSPEATRALQRFETVIARVAPVAEAECKKLGIVSSCDLQIFVDDRPGLDGNAFQTRDRFGRPAILFTLPLLVDARNEDELAFILAHEAAHQIEGHIGATERSAEQGAMIFGSLAQAQGQSRADIAAAAALGAQVGARRFSKVLELRADRLGTVIAARAGYDPVLGSAYFARIPDPGDEFLGTHPPNAERKALVREVSATLARQP